MQDPAVVPAVPVEIPRSYPRQLWDVLRGAHLDYTRVPLGRSIVLLAIPMVLEMLMESAFAICDVYFVSRLGDDSVAAVGLTESMLTIVYALGVGVSMATTALVARRIGERNNQGAVRAATAAIAVGASVGLVLGGVCLFIAPRLLALMGAPPSVLSVGSAYTTITLGGNVVILLLFLNNAVLRGAGDAALAMRVLWIANGVNLILDPCLIFGLGPFPALGVTGAAVATLTGRSVGVLYQLWLLRSGKSRIALAGPAFRFEPRVALELLRLSLGGVGQFLIATASWVVLMRIVSPFGEAAVAGYTIAIRIVVFALLPSWGIGNAAATLVGQNLGAGQPERAERAVWLTGFYNMLFLALVTVLFLAFAPALVGLFTDRPETRAVAVQALRTLSYGYVFYAWGMVLTQAFNGAGDTLTPTRIDLVAFWLVEIPLAFALARWAGLGPAGVFWSVAVAEAVMTILAFVAFRRGRWKHIKLAADVSAQPAPA